MPIQIYSLGSGSHMDAGGGTGGAPPPDYVTTLSLPAPLAVGAYIRIRFVMAYADLFVTDSQGNTYTYDAGVNFVESTLTHALTSADTLSLRFTVDPRATGTSFTYMGYVAWAVTGHDPLYPRGVGDAPSVVSVPTLTETWGPNDLQLPLNNTGRYATEALVVYEGITGESRNFGDFAYYGVTLDITGSWDVDHTSIGGIVFHAFTPGTYGDSVWRIDAGYRSFPGPVTADTATLTETFNPMIMRPGVPPEFIHGFNAIANAVFYITKPLPGSWCLCPRRGGLHAAYESGGNIKYKISPTVPNPVFGAEITVGSDTQNDYEPRMVDDWRDRIWLHFTRLTDTYYTWSDGDGVSGSWKTTPVLMFSGCKHPHVLYDARSRTLLFTAWEISTGKLKGALKGPADSAPGTAFTLKDDTGADLVLDDDLHCIAPAQDGSGRWALTGWKGGVFVAFQSTDDGATWTQTV